MEQHDLKADLLTFHGLLAGLRQYEEPDSWLVALLVEQLEERRRMLEEEMPTGPTT